MATIVTHKERGGQFILLGGGFGAYKSRVPGIVFGNLFPSEDKGEILVALLCDSRGQLGWGHTHDLEVLSVDGVAPADLLDSEVTLDPPE